MSRDLEEENYYLSQGGGKIPVKWTAPEVRIMTATIIRTIKNKTKNNNNYLFKSL